MNKWIPYILLFSLLVSLPDCEFGDPNWDLTPQNYEFSATIAAAQIFIDGIEQTGGKLAAFFDNEVRAIDINGSSFFPPAETNVYELSIWSNQPSGEILNFKYYSDNNDIVIDLNETYEFISNDIQGDAFNPISLTAVNPDCENENSNHFGDPAANTGVSEMIILSSSISTLEIGDQIGIFDTNGIISNDCSHTVDEILVGYGEWDGNQLEIVASSSVDYCDFANTELPGFVEDNLIVIKVWDISEQIEYDAILTISQGSADFQETSFVVISEINPGAIYGCMDNQACNYNENVNTDNNSCQYPEENYDCDGNCIVSVDCNGICGGNAILDECGVCDGIGASYECLDGQMVCHSSDCVDSQFPYPDLFDFVSSTGTAYYYITNAYVNDLNLDDDDWIGAFNGDVCVGARQWDIDMCANNICDIALMGVNSLDDETSEYMQNGDIPSFKIYDMSENTYYNANPSSNYGWETGGIFVIDELNESDYYCNDTPSCSGCLDTSACNYNSDALISDTCYYIDDITLLTPIDNELLELDELPGGSLTFSWSETHESCIENPNYQIHIFNQSFDLILSQETDNTIINIPYDLLDIDINELNLYSWFITGVNFFATSDTYYFTIDPTAMDLEDNTNYSFELLDNYPNPFNPVTEIGFTIPYHSFVNINIYDISGNFINKLTENYYSAGLYKVYWDASNFSSGIYIYEIQLNNYSLRKKMVLVK